MQIELDDPAVRRDQPPAAGENLEQLAVRHLIRDAPGLLDGRLREQLRNQPVRELLQLRCGTAGQLVGQHVPQPTGHVNRGEQLMDEVAAERFLNLRVGQQLIARLRPVVGVQRLAIDPHGKAPHEQGDRRDRDEDRDDQPGRPAACRALRRRSRDGYHAEHSREARVPIRSGRRARGFTPRSSGSEEAVGSAVRAPRVGEHGRRGVT
jgi:hypothetical protein